MENTKKLLRFYLDFHSGINLGILGKSIQSQDIMQGHTVKLICNRPERITLLDSIHHIAARRSSGRSSLTRRS